MNYDVFMTHVFIIIKHTFLKILSHYKVIFSIFLCL